MRARHRRCVGLSVVLLFGCWSDSAPSLLATAAAPSWCPLYQVYEQAESAPLFRDPNGNCGPNFDRFDSYSPSCGFQATVDQANQAACRIFAGSSSLNTAECCIFTSTTPEGETNRFLVQSNNCTNPCVDGLDPAPAPPPPPDWCSNPESYTTAQQVILNVPCQPNPWNATPTTPNSIVEWSDTCIPTYVEPNSILGLAKCSLKSIPNRPCCVASLVPPTNANVSIFRAILKTKDCTSPCPGPPTDSPTPSPHLPTAAPTSAACPGGSTAWAFLLFLATFLSYGG